MEVPTGDPFYCFLFYYDLSLARVTIWRFYDLVINNLNLHWIKEVLNHTILPQLMIEPETPAIKFWYLLLADGQTVPTAHFNVFYLYLVLLKPSNLSRVIQAILVALAKSTKVGFSACVNISQRV